MHIGSIRTEWINDEYIPHFAKNSCFPFLFFLMLPDIDQLSVRKNLDLWSLHGQSNSFLSATTRRTPLIESVTLSVAGNILRGFCDFERPAYSSTDESLSYAAPVNKVRLEVGMRSQGFAVDTRLRRFRLKKLRTLRRIVGLSRRTLSCPEPSSTINVLSTPLALSAASMRRL